jgi:carotenoid cleavage dioxygenase-like enzyme
MMFERDRPSRFGIVPRHGDNSNIRWFESPACFVFHTMNAYEEGNEVVLIACRMNSTTMFYSPQDTDTNVDPQANITRLHQWRFNINTGTVRGEMLDDVPTEFPRVNENFLGRQTRYGYALKMGEGLIKYDFSNGKSQTHDFGRDRYGGEAVFVPFPNGTSEDEGWLITFVYDSQEDTSELVIVNAQDVNAKPVARVLIPQRVPYGFHGAWVSEEQLSASV